MEGFLQANHRKIAIKSKKVLAFGRYMWYHSQVYEMDGPLSCCQVWATNCGKNIYNLRRTLKWI